MLLFCFLFFLLRVCTCSFFTVCVMCLYVCLTLLFVHLVPHSLSWLLSFLVRKGNKIIRLLKIKKASIKTPNSISITTMLRPYSISKLTVCTREYPLFVECERRRTVTAHTFFFLILFACWLLGIYILFPILLIFFSFREFSFHK